MKISSFIFFAVLFIVYSNSRSQVNEQQYGVFQFELKAALSADPGTVYDAASGDISGWWDHSFSEKPYKLYIEARPGGSFMEIFDESGDGVRHAVVTAAQRGKLLRFVGPLGLAGKAVQIVTSYHFMPIGSDSTELKVDVHMAGEIDKKWAEIVKKVWHHFIFEQFEPYVKSKAYLKK